MNVSKFSLLFSVVLFALINTTIAQTITITGKVKDEKGAPVSGASVLAKNTQKGISTDTSGSFTIKTKHGVTLTFSAVGFADTTLLVSSETNLVVVLRQATNTLTGVVVSGTPQNTSPSLSNEIANEQYIDHALQDYANGEHLTSGVTQYSGLTGGGASTRAFHVVTTGVLNTVNYGGMLPVYHQKEDTKGTRLLFNPWGKGLIVDQLDTIINNPSYSYNYDKITGNLLLTQDMQNSIEVERPLVKSFAIRNSSGGYVFEHVPVISKDAFFLLLAKGTKYAAYKSIKTKLIKANYQSTGLTESGNNYDEYTDEVVYYIIDVKSKTAAPVELKKKSIKAALEGEKNKTDKYFNDHRDDDITEDFVRGLINYVNIP
jgi:carboxypeptidase-like protein